jgi:hypothetical protein
MADKQEKGGGELQSSDVGDNVRIDVRNDADLERWSSKLGVPKEEFRTAAEQAGPWIRDIRQHLVGGFTGAGPTS